MSSIGNIYKNIYSSQISNIYCDMLIIMLITIIYYILGPLIYDLRGKILEPIAILVDGLFSQINSSLPTCEQSQFDCLYDLYEEDGLLWQQNCP